MTTSDINLTTEAVAELLQVPRGCLLRIAREERLEFYGGCWDLRRLRQIALRLLIIGTPEEQDAARRTLDELRAGRWPLASGSASPGIHPATQASVSPLAARHVGLPPIR
jgi:hypothetical protein